MEWHYLDALNQSRGPVSDFELVSIIEQMGDCKVWCRKSHSWILASELAANDDAFLYQISHDANGQPTNPRFNTGRLADRSITEMLGIIRGVLIDGDVSVAETEGMRNWLRNNPRAAAAWPASVISDRIQKIFADGHVTEEERRELADLLNKVTGGDPVGPIESKSSRLPLDAPQPDLVFREKVFVMTGTFAYGTRDRCEQAVVAKGGECGSSVTLKTHYVVLGTMCTESWAHSSYGRKIERALQLRQVQPKKKRICIISEEHWAKFLSV